MASPDLSLITSFDLRKGRADLERQLRQIESRPIRLNTKRGEMALGRITGKVTEFDKSLEASNARVIAFGASVAVIESVRRSFLRLLNVTVQVESQLNQINSIFGRTEKTIRGFGNSLFAIARDTGQSFDQVAKTAQEFARQGLSIEKTLERTKNALILTRLTTLSTDAAVDGLTATLNGFQRQALTSAQVLNKLRAVETSFAVSSTDLIEALSRSASVAQDANLSFEELLGSVTAIKQRTGLGGATIGQGLKTALTRINIPSRIEELQRLGVEINDSATGLERLQAVARAFRAAQDAGETERATEIGIAIAGQFQISKISPLLADLASSYSVVEEATKRANQATNEAIIANEQYNKTLEATRNRLRENLDEIFTRFSEAGGGRDAFKQILDSINNVLESVRGIKVEANNAFDGLIFDSIRLTKEWGLLSDLAKGFFNVLTGPTLVAGIAIIGNLFKNTLTQGGKSLMNLLNINKATKDREMIQTSINALLDQATAKELNAFNNAKTLADQKRAILSIMERQIYAQQQLEGRAIKVAEAFRQQGIALSGTSVRDFHMTKKTSVGGMIDRARGVGNFASGLVPALQNESQSIKRGVGGASPTAKPKVIENFNYGGGKIGPAVVNTDEYLVRHPKGDGVYNKDMVSQMGLPKGAKKVGDNFAMGARFGFPLRGKNKIFQRGFNFANGKIDNFAGGVGMGGILNKAIQAKNKRQFFGLTFQKADGTTRKGRFLMTGGVTNNLMDRKGSSRRFYHKDIPMDEKILPLLDIELYSKYMKSLVAQGYPRHIAKKMAAQKSVRSANLRNVKSIRTGGQIFNMAEGMPVENFARGLDNRDIQRLLAKKRTGQPLTDIQFRKLSHTIETGGPAGLRMRDFGELSELHKIESQKRIARFAPSKVESTGGFNPLLARERREALGINMTRGTSTDLQRRLQAERFKKATWMPTEKPSNVFTEKMMGSVSRVSQSGIPSGGIDPSIVGMGGVDEVKRAIIRHREILERRRFLEDGIMPRGTKEVRSKFLKGVHEDIFTQDLSRLATQLDVDPEELLRSPSAKEEIRKLKNMSRQKMASFYKIANEKVAQAHFEAARDRIDTRGGRGMLASMGIGLDRQFKKEFNRIDAKLRSGIERDPADIMTRKKLQAELDRRKIAGAEKFRSNAFMASFILSMGAPLIARGAGKIGASDDVSSRIESALSMAGTGMMMGAITGNPKAILAGAGIGLVAGAVTGGSKKESEAERLTREFEELQEVLNDSRNNLNAYLQTQSQLNDLFASGTFTGRQIFELQRQSMESLNRMGNISSENRMALAIASDPFDRAEIAGRISREMAEQQASAAFEASLANITKGAFRGRGSTEMLVGTEMVRSPDTSTFTLKDKELEQFQELIRGNLDFEKILKDSGGNISEFAKNITSEFENLNKSSDDLLKFSKIFEETTGVSLDSINLAGKGGQALKEFFQTLIETVTDAETAARLRSTQLQQISMTRAAIDSRIGQRQVRSTRMGLDALDLGALNTSLNNQIREAFERSQLEITSSLFGTQNQGDLRVIQSRVLQERSQENVRGEFRNISREVFNAFEEAIEREGPRALEVDIQSAINLLKSGEVKSFSQLETITSILSRLTTDDNAIAGTLTQILDNGAKNLAEIEMQNKAAQEMLKIQQSQERMMDAANAMMRESGLGVISREDLIRTREDRDRELSSATRRSNIELRREFFNTGNEEFRQFEMEDLLSDSDRRIASSQNVFADELNKFLKEGADGLSPDLLKDLQKLTETNGRDFIAIANGINRDTAKLSEIDGHLINLIDKASLQLEELQQQREFSSKMLEINQQRERISEARGKVFEETGVLIGGERTGIIDSIRNVLKDGLSADIIRVEDILGKTFRDGVQMIADSESWGVGDLLKTEFEALVKETRGLDFTERVEKIKSGLEEFAKTVLSQTTMSDQAGDALKLLLTRISELTPALKSMPVLGNLEPDGAVKERVKKLPFLAGQDMSSLRSKGGIPSVSQFEERVLGDARDFRDRRAQAERDASPAAEQMDVFVSKTLDPLLRVISDLNNNQTKIADELAGAAQKISELRNATAEQLKGELETTIKLITEIEGGNIELSESEKRVIQDLFNKVSNIEKKLSGRPVPPPTS